MSSAYRLLCASHDPAIIIGDDLSSADVEAIRSRDAIPGDHAACDIIAGRYSYPMIEAACLGIQLPGTTGCSGHHNRVTWTGTDWLRLLHAARADALPLDLTARFSCWPPDRLRRLRNELGLDDSPTMTSTSTTTPHTTRSTT